MHRAKIWGWRLLVAAAAVLFALLMLFSYVQIPGYVFDGPREAMYREWEATSRAEGDLALALRWKKEADLVRFQGRLGIAACLSSLAVFVAAVWVKRRSSRPAAVRAAAFLTRAMSLGFWLSVAALILLYTLVFVYPSSR